MISEIKAIIRPERLPDVLRALHLISNLPGVTVSTVRGFGRRFPTEDAEPIFDEVEMTKLEIVVADTVVSQVVQVLEQTAHTGHAGDGKIFVIPVRHAIKIRSGKHDLDAL